MIKILSLNLITITINFKLSLAFYFFYILKITMLKYKEWFFFVDFLKQ